MLTMSILLASPDAKSASISSICARIHAAISPPPPPAGSSDARISSRASGASVANSHASFSAIVLERQYASTSALPRSVQSRSSKGSRPGSRPDATAAMDEVSPTRLSAPSPSFAHRAAALSTTRVPETAGRMSASNSSRVTW